MVDSPHGKGVTFTILSRPVGYAAEYLTRGAFPAIPMGRFPLMFIYCILYHFPLLHGLHGLNYFVYFVYFVVQTFASFAFFAATVTMSFYTANHPSTTSQ